MSDKIKKGTLVKAWAGYIEDYEIGVYTEPDEIYGHWAGEAWFADVVEIPADIVKKIESLGK